MAMKKSEKPGKKKRYRRLVGTVLSLSVLWLVFSFFNKPPTQHYETAFVDEGTVQYKISAAGRIAAREVVDIGAEISGMIRSVPVRYNQYVAKGDLLAEIDPTAFRSRVIEVRAELAGAMARHEQAIASVQRIEAQLEESRSDLSRKTDLHDTGYASDQSLEAARSLNRQNEAALTSALADIKIAKATIRRLEATLGRAELDLQRTRILSPIDGIVINRLIDPGQTVASAFQTPVLFQIAADLSKMQLEAQIDEIDIGLIRTGQPSVIKIDAFPERTFTGTVEEIRKIPNEDRGIVSYPVIVSVDNDSGQLLPGMTADLDLIVAQQQNVPRLPASALGFHPWPNGTKQDEDGFSITFVPRSEVEQFKQQSALRDQIRKGKSPDNIVWLPPEKADGPPVAVKVIPGLKGEDYVELLGDVLRPGDKVITGLKNIALP